MNPSSKHPHVQGQQHTRHHKNHKNYNAVVNFVIRQLLKNDKKHIDKPEKLSDYAVAKGYYNFKVLAKQQTSDVLFMIAGVLSAAFGLESFLMPNHFIDGGVTGISMLTWSVTGIPLYVWLAAINAPFIFMANKIVGKAFAIKTTFTILGLTLAVAFIHFPEITHEKLLVAVFGGFFLGAGIGLAVRGGAVLDGTEVLSIFLSKKLGVKISDVIVVINIGVFLVAAWLLSVDSALYSIITYLAAYKTLDFVIEGIEEYTGVTIVSAYSEEIRRMIIDDMGKGVTVYVGKRGFGKDHIDVDIIYTIITRLELNKLNSELERIDPNAFVTMSSVKDTRGGVVKKRPLGDH